MKRKLTFGAILLLGGYLLLEAGTCTLMKMNILRGEMPAFTWSRIGIRFFRDGPEPWATWHEPNSVHRHAWACFDYEYRFNADGMRDRPRERQDSPSRVVVLGDSFIEGWGVAEEDRLTNLLEKAKGREFLNFGTSGSFGPLQYYLIYENLAKNFSHDSVLVGILPMNDFDDDNYEVWAKKGRRRPFWVGEPPELRYTETIKYDSAYHRFRRFLKEYSYFFNTVEDLYQGWQYRRRSRDEKVTSRFYDFTEEEWERMLFSLQKLRDASRGKRLTLVLFPIRQDLKRFRPGEKPPLTARLEAWGKEQDVEVIDLVPWLHDYQQDWEPYHLSCDNHYSALGYRAAFELVQKYY